MVNIKVRLCFWVVNQGDAHEGGSDRGGRSQLPGANITYTPIRTRISEIESK